MKLWGGRFSGSASPSAEAFGASIGFDFLLWRYDIMGSIAHARMLADQNIISAEDGKQIIEGLGQIADELAVANPESASFSPQALTPAWEDVHTWIEGRLRTLIGEPAGRLHTARSRNDQVALDLRMYAREAILHQVDALVALQQALLTLASAHTETVMPGYTHLQRAQPIVLGHHVLAYVEMLQRDAERLLECYRRTNVCPLGSGALAGVSYPIDRAETARHLGFDRISQNSLDAVSDRDFVVEQLAALALVAAHLSRFAEEIVLWQSAEFGFSQLDDAYSTGSSIMPQKRNPDLAELIRGKTGRVYGHLVALLTVLKGLPLAYNKDLQEDKEAFFDAVDTVDGSTRIMAEMVAAIRPQAGRLASAAGAGFSTATDYADYLARKGVPFREAHAIVGKLVQACEERAVDLWDLTLDELRKASPLFDADIVGYTAAQAASARDVPGGTAPARVAQALAEARVRCDDLAREIAGRRETLPTIDALLAEIALDP